MPRPRVGQQIKEALHGKKSTSNKSANLDFLTVQFKRLKVKIRNLIEALRAQHLSLLRINETRLLVASRVAALAVESPIADDAGAAYGHEATSANKTDDLSSYMSVHQNLHTRQKMYCDRFLEHVVEYAVEWEKVIVSRVSSSLIKADKLRIELEHYQSKVDSIRTEKTRRIERGGMIDSKLADKLFRNEAKLGHSRKIYETYASDLAKLIEEVTTRSWKDLHPIILKMSQFDATLASDEHQLLSHLNQVADNLKKIAHRYHLNPDSRVKELETLTENVFSSTSLLENEHSCEAVSPNRSKEPQIDAINSQKVRGSTSSSKENQDEVIHGVLNTLTSHTSTTRPSKTRKEKSIAQPLSILEAANKSMRDGSPRSSSRNRGTSKGTTREMKTQSYSSASTGEVSPRCAVRSETRPSSRNRGHKASRDERSTSNPFDGIDVKNKNLAMVNHGQYISSPRSSSNRDNLRQDNNRHIPRSPRNHSSSRHNTPTRRIYNEEQRQDIQAHSPRVELKQYPNSQYENFSGRNEPRMQNRTGSYHDGDRYATPSSPRRIPPQQQYPERVENESKVAKPWYQFY